MKIQYAIGGGMNEGQLKRIHETALRILDEIGMQVHSEVVPDGELLERVSAHDGVRIVNGRVCFRPALVERLLKEYQAQLGPPANPQDGELTIHTIGHACNILDPATGKLRPCNTADLAGFARLANTFHDEGLRGGCPGFPNDVPGPLRPVAQYKINCEHSRTRASASAESPAAAEFIYEMAKVMGYASGQGHSVGVHPVSPLRLEGNEFDIALHFWKKLGDKLSVGCGPMPIVGVSAPIFLPGAMAQAIAEGLGCFVFFKLLTGGGAGFWFNFYAFDMKYGNFVYGGPEDSLIALMRNQMNRWYGLPSHFGDKALNTMAHSADAHAATEKASKTVIALLAGAKYLAGAGGLSLDETCSPEQLVIDMEIVRWAGRVASGFEFNDEALALEIIREAVAGGGNFLSHDSTLAHYRETYWMPQLFEHMMKSQWDEKGGRSLRERAKEIIGQRLATECFELPEDKRMELDRIYRRAQEELG